MKYNLAAVFFTLFLSFSSNASTNTIAPAWLNISAGLIQESAISVLDKDCTYKSNVLGQVVVFGRILDIYGSEAATENYAIAAIGKSLEMYGVDARFGNSCARTDKETFKRIIEELRIAKETINSL